MARFNIEIAIGLKGAGSREADAAFKAIGGGALNAQVRVQGLEGIVGKLRTAFLAYGGLAFLGKIIRETSEAEDSLAQLRAGVISTGGAAGWSAEQLAKMATDIQLVTRYSDEAVAGAEKILLTFRQIKGNTFREATQAVVDLTAKLGGDLEDRAKLIGKLLSGSLGAAAKAGIVFDDQQKKLIKTLFETGQAEKAQAIILKELQAVFGGSAAAAVDTLGGSMDSLKNQIGEVFEAIGGELSPSLVSLRADLQAFVTSDEFARLAREIGRDLASGIRLSADALKFLVGHADQLKALVTAYATLRFGQLLFETAAAARAAAAGIALAKGEVLGLNLAMLATPFGAVLAGLALIAGALAGLTASTRNSAIEFLNSVAAQQQESAVLQKLQGSYTIAANGALALRKEVQLLSQAEIDNARALTLKNQILAEDLAHQAAAKYRDASAAKDSMVFDAAYAEGQRLENQSKMLDFQAKRANAALDLEQAALDKVGKVAERTSTVISDAQKKALEAVRKTIAELQRQAALKKDESIAAGIGPEAERAFARIKAIADEVAKARQQLADQKLALPPELQAAIEAAAGALFDYGEATDLARSKQEALSEAVSSASERLAALRVSVRTNLTLTFEEASDSATALRSLIAALTDTLSRTSKETEAYATLQKQLAEASSDYTQILVRMIALRRQDAVAAGQARDLQKANLAAILQEIRLQTDLRGKHAAVAQALLQELDIRRQVQQIVSESVKPIEGEGANKDFAARWLAAAQEVRATLEANLKAGVQAGITEPARQGAATMKSQFLDAVAAWATGADVSARQIIQSWLQMWTRAFLEWLARWTATQVKAAAVARGAKIAGGSGAGGGTIYTGLGPVTAGGGTSTAGLSASTLAGAAFAAYALYIVYQGFVKKGEQWAESSTHGGGTGNNSGVANSVRQRLGEIVQAVTALSKEFELGLKDVGDVTLGKRGKTYYVKDIENAIGTAFSSAEAAMEYAEVRALQLAKVSDNLGTLVKAALRGSQKVTIEGLKGDIDFARMLQNTGLPELQQQMQSFFAQFENNWSRALQLFRNDLPALGEALGQVGAILVQSLTDTYNELTGRKKDEAADAERRRAVYNAQVVLITAQITAIRLEIEAKRASILAYRAHAQATASDAEVTLRSGRVLALAAGLVGGATDEVLARLEQQIAAIDSVLRSLPPLIQPGELVVPGQRGGGGGNSVADDRQQVRDFLKALDLKHLSAFGQALAELNKQFDEEMKNAHGDAKLIEELNRKRAEEIKLLREQATKELYGKIKDFEKNPFKQSGFSDAVAEVQKKAEELSEEFKKNAKDMGWSAERIAKGLARIDAAEERHLRFLSQQAFVELTGSLADIVTDDKVRADLLRAQEIITFQMKMVQLRAEFELVKSLGYLTDQQIGILQEGFDWIAAHAADLPGGANWHPDTGPAGGTGQSAQELYAQRLQEAADAAREAADEFRRSVDELIRGRDQFLLGDNSPLTAAMQYEEAQRQYQENLRLALGGDIDARNRFNDLANQLRDIFQGAYGSQGIQTLMDQVLADYARLIGAPAGTIFGNVAVGGNFGGRGGSSTGAGAGSSGAPVQPTGGNVGFNVTPIVVAIDSHRRQNAGDAAELLAELRGFRSDQQVARGGR